MFALAMGLLLQTQGTAHSSTAPVAPPAQVLAVRAANAGSTPVIDGSADDAVWAGAQLITGFREARPVEDADPRLPTEARIAYDERNLYIFVRAVDQNPDSIVRRLARRDSDVASDWITIYVDSYHDRRTGFRFSVNPVGVKVDGVLYNDGNEDWAWDGVWDVTALVDSGGWSAEFRIPLSQLRYPSMPSNTFGISIRRWISRYTADVSWPLYRQSQPGTASQMGELTGLTGLASPRRVELTPYVVTRNVDVPNGTGYDREQKATVGGDLKYAVTSNVTLTATVNPDFGQVEADPSVLNLGAFETFFRERRPFFVEGTGLFRVAVNCFIVNDCSTGEGLLYSRRIGRAPQLAGTYPSDDAPTSSAIIGAAKITGRTSKGLAVGVLDAVTEHVKGGAAGDATIEPLTNYSVVRALQDFRGGESNIGLIATGVHRRLDSFSDQLLRKNAYVGALDFYHRFPGKRYQLSGAVNLSQVNGAAAVIDATQRDRVHYFQRPDGRLAYDPTRTSLSGYSSEVRFAKFGGERTNFETAVGRRSPGFEINDLGFLQRADEQNWSSWMALRWRKPRAFYQNIQWNLNMWHHWTVAEKLPLNHAFNTNIHMTFNNRWSLHTGGTIGALGSVFCDRCARGGPAIREDMTVSWWGGIVGDSRKSVQPEWWFNYYRGDGGRTISVNTNPSIDFKFGSRFSSSLGVSVTHNRDHTQWYDNVTDGVGTHYLFAHLDQKTASITWRIDYTISPTTTLQVYASPFVSKGTYSSLRELSGTPRAPDYDARYGAPTLASPLTPGGFNFKQFRSNVVFRWEYRPGSTLFLVWQQGREDDADIEGNRTLGADLQQLFDVRASNALLVKASYWLNW